MNECPPVRLLRLPNGQGLSLPSAATPSSAGFDLCAAVDETLVLRPGERRLIPTGFAWEIPAGFEGQIRPRSGLAVKHGLTLLNAPGTVDSDYRGEVCVILCNLGGEPFPVKRGARIAQMVVAPVARCRIVEVEGLTPTERGAGGFGHTGT